MQSMGSVVFKSPYNGSMKMSKSMMPLNVLNKITVHEITVLSILCCHEQKFD